VPSGDVGLVASALDDVEEPLAEEAAGDKERVEELKNELKRELTIDDLPF